MSQQFQDAFKGHVTINTERNFMKKAWWMFDEKLSQIFEKVLRSMATWRVL